MHQLPWYADYSPTQLKNGIEEETEDDDNAAASAVNNVPKMLIHEK